MSVAFRPKPVAALIVDVGTEKKKKKLKLKRLKEAGAALPAPEDDVEPAIDGQLVEDPKVEVLPFLVAVSLHRRRSLATTAERR